MSGLLYVAGPISGIDGYKSLFQGAADALTRKGYRVMNPCDNTITEPDASETRIWQQYMRISLGQIAAADGIATLDGWLKSRGASLEVFIAAQLGITIMPVSEWLR